MKKRTKKRIGILLTLLLLFSAAQPAMAAGVTYMPDVTAEMSSASCWADLHEDADKVILTQDEINALNQNTALASGTMIIDLKNAAETFDGIARNEAVRASAAADAKYYYGWTYQSNGKKADWAYYEKMIENCIDPNATEVRQVRYGIAVNRTVLQVFPSSNQILDDPNDLDFDYQALSGIRVNEPMLIYNTSADGKYYMARIASCSGWVPVQDVALCADKAEWLSAWDIPSSEMLVIYDNYAYTASSNVNPATARRLLTQGTRLELITDLKPDQLINNRSSYHNYAVYLPVRQKDGSYTKQAALIPETVDASIGYLPLTKRNIAMAAMNHLGDAYGWGGMLNVDDCTGMIRTIYSCFGLEVARNGNWQWNMNIEKIDMSSMSLEEKCHVLDQLPFGTALSFPGHQMLYLGKTDGKYYVLSTVSSIMSPDTGNRLRTRDVMINTLDVKRANGKSWVGALDRAFLLYYPSTTDKQYDVPSLQWYHDGVAYCMTNSIMTGDINGAFGIGNPVTGQELAQALRTMTNGPIPETAGPEYESLQTITRQQAVTALWQFEQTQQKKAAVTSRELTAYADASLLQGDARSAAEWAYGAGIIAGTGSGTLGLDNPVTREQLAVMIYRYSMLP